MKSLITNFKTVNLINNIQGLTLDLEKATPFEINMFVGYLLGRITASDVRNPRQYTILDNQLILDHHISGRNYVVQDYYHNHEAAHLLLIHHGIAIVFDKDNNVYRASKITIENEEIVSDGKYLSDSETSSFINEAGLKTLINVLSYDNMERLVELEKEFN